MNEQAIATVKATVPVLRENGVALTSYFYKRMLNNHPELNNVFNLSHQTTGRQPRALAAAVLAYAENIEDPSKLLKAVDRIAIKHVSLNIHPDQYAIVGDNLLHSISEVLALPMDHDVITAWASAYGQLADILIAHENALAEKIKNKHGGWAGWRQFKIIDKQSQQDKSIITLAPVDGQAISTAETGSFVSIKVDVPHRGIQQPLQFNLNPESTEQHYQVTVTHEITNHDAAGADVPSVPNILIDDIQVGDVVEVTAPLSYS